MPEGDHVRRARASSVIGCIARAALYRIDFEEERKGSQQVEAGDSIRSEQPSTPLHSTAGHAESGLAFVWIEACDGLKLAYLYERRMVRVQAVGRKCLQ